MCLVRLWLSYLYWQMKRGRDTENLQLYSLRKQTAPVSDTQLRAGDPEMGVIGATEQAIGKRNPSECVVPYNDAGNLEFPVVLRSF